MTKNKWIIGNWKMNGSQSLVQEFENILSDLHIPAHIQVGIAPPFPYLPLLKTMDNTIRIGAQNISQFDQDGAFTGEINSRMLQDCGATFVLIGHSERRTLFGETDNQLHQKTQNTLNAGLIPVYCVGENLSVRQTGQENEFISSQLEIILPLLTLDTPFLIAYEPVWAIGTGEVATQEQISAMHEHIRQFLLSKEINTDNIFILYGGSVNAENAQHILKLPNVDGALIGGAALKTEQFIRIIKAVEN